MPQHAVRLPLILVLAVIAYTLSELVPMRIQERRSRALFEKYNGHMSTLDLYR